MTNINDTHDASLRSWVVSANGHPEFPIQNLPLGVFRRSSDGTPRVGVAIGNEILDLHAVSNAGLLSELGDDIANACREQSLNGLMSMSDAASSALRRHLSHLLRDGAPGRVTTSPHLVPMADVTLDLPAKIGDYTDFYASIHHATNVGSMFRPDNPLLPNYKWVPIGYHGRASSIVPSGTSIRRPKGQLKNDEAAPPQFGPSRRLDYEMEVGVFIARGNELGEPVEIDRADKTIFGLCLVNDWSARDIQTWEYQPLGPFLAKNFGTSVSPWIVTREALAPFRTQAWQRDAADPQPLDYLKSERDQNEGGFDLTVEVHLTSAKMRALGMDAVMLSRGNFRDMYWTVAQLIAHHTSNGCNLKPGDLIASGTISGSTKDARGSMLELAWRGTEPIELPTGEMRKFLEDGDEVIMRGYCEREGFARIGFGECRGIISSAE